MGETDHLKDCPHLRTASKDNWRMLNGMTRKPAGIVAAIAELPSWDTLTADKHPTTTRLQPQRARKHKAPQLSPYFSAAHFSSRPMFLLRCFYALFIVALRTSYVYFPPEVSNLGILRSYPWSWLGIPTPVVRNWFPYKWLPSVEVWCNRGRCTLSKVSPTFPLAFEVVASCLTGYLLVSLCRSTLTSCLKRLDLSDSQT
jgi:hypothetical protein